jgi:hypothetical protein
MNLEHSRTGPMATVPQTLSRLLQSEHLHGMTEWDPNEKCLGFHYFSKNSYFIHIEDLPTANDDQLLLKAIEWKMKIWTVAKLESVLDRCQAPMNLEHSRTGPMATVPQTHSHLLQSERLHGMTEWDPNEKCLGFHYFSKNSYFINTLRIYPLPTMIDSCSRLRLLSGR